MVVTRSIDDQMVTRSKSGPKYHYIQLAAKSKKMRSNRQTVSKTLVYDYEPRYWVEDDTLILVKPEEMKSTIKIEEDDDESVVTEYDDILRHQKPIDFDEAHDAWMANKKRTSHGCYVYLCGKILTTGKPCRNARCDSTGLYSGCKRHYAWEEADNKYL